MISVLLQCLCLGVAILGYKSGGDPLVTMFCIGWCAAFVFVSAVKAISEWVRS